MSNRYDWHAQIASIVAALLVGDSIYTPTVLILIASGIALSGRSDSIAHPGDSQVGLNHLGTFYRAAGDV